jgi:hypothetical protein
MGGWAASYASTCASSLSLAWNQTSESPIVVHQLNDLEPQYSSQFKELKSQYKPLENQINSNLPTNRLATKSYPMTYQPSEDK